MTTGLGRIPELFDQLSEEMLNLRIAVAQQRDDLLTEAEMIAMLKVYAEFGR